MRFPATLALSFLLLAAPALAGGVHGRVRDRTGGALAGATIHILNIATGEQATVVADAEGQYRVPELKVGTYRIAASLTGFSDAARNVIVETASTDATDSTVIFFSTWTRSSWIRSKISRAVSACPSLPKFM